MVQVMSSGRTSRFGAPAVFDDLRAVRVGLADDAAAVGAAAGEDDGVAEVVVAAALVVERADGAAELAHDDDQRLVEDVHGGEIGEQRAEGGVELRALRVERLRGVAVVDVGVMVPAAEGGLDEARALVRGDEVARDDRASRRRWSRRSACARRR